jgi:phage/plasmid-like protein (TIGR03299 family)
MAHELESMLYVGETPWHGLGNRLITAPKTVEEALEASGLNWDVNVFPLYANIPLDTLDASGKKQFLKVPVPGRAVVRSSDNKVLGQVGKGYTPVQNRDGFAFFNAAIEAGLAEIETAGSLRGGQRVWMLANLLNTEADVVSGDPVKAYFLVSNSHDGTLAVRVGFSAIRVVCQNTLSLAHHEGRGKLIQVRHTKNVKDALGKLQEIVDWQRGTFSATVEQFKFLASKGCDEALLRQYVTEVFAPEHKARNVDKIAVSEDAAEESQENSIDKLLESITPLFVNGRGNQLPGVAGTLWAGYNAITEYQTWERGRSNDTRLDSLWFGQNKKTNERAFEVALKMAA